MIVHSGQHYDRDMSDTFFSDLEIPQPDCNLEVGSGTHAQQTAAIMERFEPVCVAESPDMVLVYGDVNSTVAAALVAAKLGLRVAHVEAGLRSRDWSMPEEINRVVTDRLSDLLFTPSADADVNLLAEGIPPDRIHFVGNIMIDALIHALPRAGERRILDYLGLKHGGYGLVTLHRPSNVDDADTLHGILAGLEQVARLLPLVFPMHPRTSRRIKELQGSRAVSNLRLLEPLGYLDMVKLVTDAELVITDSGGLQEETTFLGVPCLTIRPSTERPITCERGTNRLVASTRDAICTAAREALNGRSKRVRPTIERWDGQTAGRIVDVIGRGAT